MGTYTNLLQFSDEQGDIFVEWRGPYPKSELIEAKYEGEPGAAVPSLGASLGVTPSLGASLDGASLRASVDEVSLGASLDVGASLGPSLEDVESSLGASLEVAPSLGASGEVESGALVDEEIDRVVSFAL